jgi:competence protein ComEA
VERKRGSIDQNPWAAVLLRAVGGAVVVVVLAVIGALSIADQQSGVMAASGLPLARDRSRAWLAGEREPSSGSVAVGNVGAAQSRLLKASVPLAKRAPADAGAGSDRPRAEGPDGGPPQDRKEPSGVTRDGKVVLNVATASELVRLPGIGPKRAEAIVRLRARLKRFRRATDLLRVRGIGPKTLRKMLPHLVLDPVATSDAGPDSGSGSH